MAAGWHSSRRSGVAALAILGLVLPGCATQPGRIGADDGSDACRAYRVALDSTGNYFTADILQGALIGSITGTLAGALAGQDTKGMLIGAAAGAAVGAAGGYWVALQRQQHDQAVLAQTVSTDLRKENAQIDRTQSAFDQLTACRRREADKVRAALAAGQITRADAGAHMALLRSQSEQDLRIARTINGQITDRSSNFQFANEQINPQPYLVPRLVPLRATATDNAAFIGMLNGGRTYYGSRLNDGWIKIYADGAQGYVETSEATLQSSVTVTSPAPQPSRTSAARNRPPAPVPAAPPPPGTHVAGGDDVNRDAFTNVAKLNTLQASINAVAADQSAFELPPGSS